MGWDYLRCGRVEEEYTGWMIIGSCGYSEYGCNGCYVTLDYESIFEFLEGNWILMQKTISYS